MLANAVPFMITSAGASFYFVGRFVTAHKSVADDRIISGVLTRFF